MTTDLNMLQGLWRQVRFEDNGLIDPPDRHGAPDAILTISGTRFHVAVPGHDALVEGNLVLQPSTEPKGIDWIDSIGEDAGQILPAIYTLCDNSFAFAAADPHMARPDDFSGGQGITIRAFAKV